MPRSRSRRSPSKGSPVMTNFTCTELTGYSPTHFILPVDYYLPLPYYTSVDQCFLSVPNMNSDPYGPYAVQLYTPPAPMPKAEPLPSPIPMSVIYSPPFMIPPYHDPYGPTAVQIYSPYIPPLVKMRSIRYEIGLGQDNYFPLPCHHSEATPLLSRSMLSAPPTQSVDFSTVSPHYLVCPVLGLFLVVVLGIYDLCCALKKLRHHERAGDRTEFEECHSAPSSFYEISGIGHKLLKENVKHYGTPESEELTGGFPIKTKFATKKRRLIRVLTKTKLVSRKRRFFDFSSHLYHLVLSSSHNEASIAGTFALYCILYSSVKRRRFHTPDVDHFEFEETLSDPSWTGPTKSKESISELYSYDPDPLIDPQHINASLSEGLQMCAQKDVHNTECDFEEFIAKPSYYEELDYIFENHHFQHEEECDRMAKNDESFELIEQTESRVDDQSCIYIAEEASAKPPDLLGLNEDPSLLNFQNTNVASAEGDQIWAQNSLSEDVGNHEFKQSYSSSMELIIAEPNNVVEKECHDIHENDYLIVSQNSKKKLLWRSGQQHSASRWYIATGMGKSNKHW